MAQCFWRVCSMAGRPLESSHCKIDSRPGTVNRQKVKVEGLHLSGGTTVFSCKMRAVIFQPALGRTLRLRPNAPAVTDQFAGERPTCQELAAFLTYRSYNLTRSGPS